MSLESVASILSVAEESQLQSTSIKANQVSFADWLGGEIGQVSNDISKAEQAAQSLVSGEAENIHQVMIALDKAQLSMSLAIEVRNKLLEGYQEIMRMSI